MKNYPSCKQFGQIWLTLYSAHVNLVLSTHAISEDSDEPAHL